jgi:hypothetical protein
MTYNRFLYNTALWNAGREEAAGIARSIIQAHTGPHIQAVVGNDGGTSFISDFVITEGTVVKPPTQFNFPDLSAWIRAYQVGPSSEGTAGGYAKDDLASLIRAQQFKDLPACIFLVNNLPNLPARIFGLLQANLIATILGELGMHDLPAIIQATVANLPARMLGINAPNLPGFIFVNPPGNLGARIWSPLDLRATLSPVQFQDLPASIRGFQFSDLPARMLGIAAPNFIAFIRGVAADIKDMPARMLPLVFDPGLPATINPVFTGDTGFGVGLTAQVAGHGGFQSLQGIVKSITSTTSSLSAAIIAGGVVDLPAIIELLGAGNLIATIGTIPLNERDRFLNAFLHALIPADLGATMTISENVAFLAATISSLRQIDDLSAFIRVAETFVTAILTISTLASRDLRATIGNPNCEGGSASVLLSAIATAQHKGDISAFIQSFAEKNLIATINTTDTFFAYDTISITFSPRPRATVPPGTPFNTTDTITINFAPFRGKNLSALLNAIQNNVYLGATITAVFPLPKVVPAVNRLTAADLRLGEDQNIQEITLQLEGALLEYIYVNGTDQAFIKDPNEDWKINVRSFRPIAAGLFGDRAAGKICRLGNLASFHTMDEAVRSCIQAVLGYTDESNMVAYIQARGYINDFPATISISDVFDDLNAFAGRVFPVDLGALVGVKSISNPNLGAYIRTTYTGVIGNMGAFIDLVRELTLTGTISGAGGAPYQPGVLNAYLLGATIPSIYQTSALMAFIDPGSNTGSFLFPGTSGGIIKPRLTVGLGSDIFSFALYRRKFSISFWVRWDNTVGNPATADTILGMATDFTKADGLGFDWVAATASDPPAIRFYVNNQSTTTAQGITSGDSTPFTTDQWVHVVGTYDANAASNNVRLYMNGVQKATKTHTIDLSGLSNALEIGRISSATPDANYPTQHFDEFGLWLGVALSGSEVTALFDEGFTPAHDLRSNRGAYTHASDLATYYRFENTATTFPTEVNAVTAGVFDGTYADLAVTDASDYTPSDDAAAMDFNSSTRFDATGTDLPLLVNTSGSFSVMAWANKNTTTALKYLAGSWHSSDTTGIIPTMRISTSSSNRWTLEMNTQGNSPTTITDSTQTVVNNGTRWYQVVTTYDVSNRSMRLYVDGTLVSSGTLSASSKRINEFTIGAARTSNSPGASPWDGFIDTVAVWDTNLSTTDVSTMYNGGTAETDLRTLNTVANLQVWYRLGEAGDTLTEIVDRSGHNRDLPRTNSGNSIVDETPFL